MNQETQQLDETVRRVPDDVASATLAPPLRHRRSLAPRRMAIEALRLVGRVDRLAHLERS